MVENVIHTYKFNRAGISYHDLKSDTISYLYERLNKFSSPSGKAYSYFTVVSRNYLIVRSSESYTQSSQKDDLDAVDANRNVVLEESILDRKNMISEFVKMWAKWGNDNVEYLFINQRDQQIANAMFDIFNSAIEVETYNKKALYVLIREHAKCKTQFITNVVNRLKIMFADMSEQYLKTGKVNWDRYLIIYTELLSDDDPIVMEDINEI